MASAARIPRTAPWDNVAPHEQLFVLITGANSGVGLGIAQRLIDQFLATRSLNSHLILIPTTRSASKSLDAVRVLREYAQTTAQNSEPLQARAGGPAAYKWQDTTARIHILSLALELCDLRGIHNFADTLRHRTLSNPKGLEGEYLIDVRIPRLDSIVFNAAYGGWTGLSYAGAIWQLLTRGIIDMATYPAFKISSPTNILNENPQYNYPPKPLLAEVFCACVFGHYVLAHQLLPLLSRRGDQDIAPGRIIWSSSLEAHDVAFDLSDIQCFSRPVAYESAKRLTDILSLTATLPAVQPYSSPFWTIDDIGSDDDSYSEKNKSKSQQEPEKRNSTGTTTIRPNMYVTHPGLVASTIFPVPWFLFWAYELALMLCRWLGSPWHAVTSYTGAVSVAWLVLQPQDALDEAEATRIKWGSAADQKGQALVKQTEVDLWGWSGRVEDAAQDTQEGILNKTRGRKPFAKGVTPEELETFQELGVSCWREMEKMRLQWEDTLAEGIL